MKNVEKMSAREMRNEIRRSRPVISAATYVSECVKHNRERYPIANLDDAHDALIEALDVYVKHVSDNGG